MRVLPASIVVVIVRVVDVIVVPVGIYDEISLQENHDNYNIKIKHNLRDII